MSWPETVMINSDISIPLNILHAMQNLELLGANGYAYNDDALMNIIAFMPHSLKLGLNRINWLQEVIDRGLHAGKYIRFRYLPGATVLENLSTIEAISGNTQATNLVGADLSAMLGIIQTTAFKLFVNNATAMSTFANNKEALTMAYLNADLVEPFLKGSSVATSAISTSKFKVTTSRAPSDLLPNISYVLYSDPALVISTNVNSQPSTNPGAGDYLLSPYNIPQTTTLQNVYRFAIRVTSSISYSSTYTHTANYIPIERV